MTRRSVLGSIVGIAICLATGVQADWTGFYRPTERITTASDSAVCLREIFAAQLRHSIPENLLLAIGLQEAGLRRDGALTIWPWTVNAQGTGHYFDDATTAINWVHGRQAQGVDSVDVGCMQINLRWHPDAFDSVSDGFDPRINVDYAARLLKDLYRQTGDWTAAAGSYHSFTPELNRAYVERLRTNVSVANNRLDEFRTLAGQSGSTPREPMQQGGILWSAWLGTNPENAGNAGHSFYGNGSIQPLLPELQRTF